MENRFGLKDLVSAVLLLGLIVITLLSMKQRDREWEVLQQIKAQNDLQARTLANLNRTLGDLAANGVSVARGSGPTTAESGGAGMVRGDPFKELRAVEAKPDFARGDWLIDNVKTKVPKLTPNISTDLYGDWVQAKVMETLAYRDPDAPESYIPLLARSYTVSPDGMKYVFQLRKGVTFSDGEPFTADDVIYSYQIIMNPKINAPRMRA